MVGNSLLLPGSSICLDSRLQLLSGPERHDAACADGNFFAGLGITARALVLIAQIEVAEARQFHLLAGGQRRAQFLEEQVHEFARLALVEPELIEQSFSDLGFGECHGYLSRIVALAWRTSWSTTCATSASATWSVRVREVSCNCRPKAMLFLPFSNCCPR